jgi:dTDP-glucose 4,6-dehydratase
MKYLVTGAAGFIGSNFVDFVLRTSNDEILAFDALTYAGNFTNLLPYVNNEKFHFIKGSIYDAADVEEAIKHDPDVIVNFAAESHVDRSILSAQAFVQTNIVGTQILLDYAKAFAVDLFVQVSTDEVYGSIDKPSKFTESSPINPSSPYSASKVAADCLALAYHKTHELPVIVTRCCNNYGPRQFPEKVIPLFITNLMQDKKVPLYADGANVRDWIFVEDHCSAIADIVHKGRVGQVYNVGANHELSNLELTKQLIKALGKDVSMIEHVKDRPGHDLRYAVDASKLRDEIGWRPATDFYHGISITVQWYKDNVEWWQDILNDKYREVYDDWYLTSI